MGGFLMALPKKFILFCASGGLVVIGGYVRLKLQGMYGRDALFAPIPHQERLMAAELPPPPPNEPDCFPIFVVILFLAIIGSLIFFACVSQPNRQYHEKDHSIQSDFDDYLGVPPAFQ